MDPPKIPSQSVFYSPPMRGRLAVQGLQGASVASLLYGGMPSPPSSTEPAGDALQVDVPMILSNDPNAGRDRDTFPSSLPSAQTLDYAHKAASLTLLALVIVLLLVYAAIRPRKALRLIEGRAGAA